MYQLSKTAPFGIKTTEAMHYRRYVAQRIRAEHGATENEAAKGVAFRTAGVSDGKGFVFVSHQGEIFPSGFLPVSGGNVLNESLTDVTVIAASLRRCATPPSAKASAASANTRRSAADLAPAPMLSLAISWPKIRVAPTSHTSPTPSQARRPEWGAR